MGVFRNLSGGVAYHLLKQKNPWKLYILLAWEGAGSWAPIAPLGHRLWLREIYFIKKKVLPWCKMQVHQNNLQMVKNADFF